MRIHRCELAHSKQFLKKASHSFLREWNQVTSARNLVICIVLPLSPITHIQSVAKSYSFCFIFILHRDTFSTLLSLEGFSVDFKKPLSYGCWETVQLSSVCHGSVKAFNIHPRAESQVEEIIRWIGAPAAFADTFVWFPEPTSGSLQPPATPVPCNLMPVLVSVGTSTQKVHIQRSRQTCTKINTCF